LNFGGETKGLTRNGESQLLLKKNLVAHLVAPFCPGNIKMGKG